MIKAEHSKEYEGRLISGCFQDENNFFKAKNKGITANDFQNPEFKEIWKRIDEVALNHGITPLIIAEQFTHNSEEQRLNTINRLEQIANYKVSNADFEFSLTKIREFTGVRALVRLAEDINASVKKGVNVEDILSKVTSDLFSINTDSDNIQEFNSFEVISETSKEIKKRLEGDVSDGVPSGISTLDAEIRCFYYALATIIIGRPGHGKTTLMVNAFVNNLRADYKPVFISLEMPAVHIVLKMLAIWAKVDIGKIFEPRRLTDDERERLKNALFEMSQKEFYIVDAVSMTVSEFGMIMLKYAKMGCHIAYLDYVQLIKMADGGIPNDAAQFRSVFKEVREILRLVNRYGTMACVMGAQAGRSVESRPVEERIPQMSDLEWSSSLEQDAAVVIGTMIPEKYQGEDCEYKNQMFLGFPKHRYENAVRVNLAFIGKYQLCADLAEPERYEKNIPEQWKEEVKRDRRKRAKEQFENELKESKWSQDIVVEEIQKLHSNDEPLDVDSIKENHPILYFAGVNFMGNWENALSASGLLTSAK